MRQQENSTGVGCDTSGTPSLEILGAGWTKPSSGMLQVQLLLPQGVSGCPIQVDFFQVLLMGLEWADPDMGLGKCPKSPSLWVLRAGTSGVFDRGRPGMKGLKGTAWMFIWDGLGMIQRGIMSQWEQTNLFSLEN